MGADSTTLTDSKRYGLRVYNLIKGGPLDKAGVSILTDFIIPPEGILSPSDETQQAFNTWLQGQANSDLSLTIYSLNSRTFHDIVIKTNPKNSNDGILGASAKKENWAIAHKNVLHIVTVKEGSFAEKELGLIEKEDFIVAIRPKNSPIISLNRDDFNPLDILGEALRKFRGEEMKFYIYNKKNGPREKIVTIGDGYDFSLGIEGAFGALHEFPMKEEKNSNNIIKGNDNLNKNENKDANNENLGNNNSNFKDKNVLNVPGQNDSNNNNNIEESAENIFEDKKDGNNNKNVEETNIFDLDENKEKDKINNVMKKKIEINNNIASLRENENVNKLAEEKSVEQELEEPAQEEKLDS